MGRLEELGPGDEGDAGGAEDFHGGYRLWAMGYWPRLIQSCGQETNEVRRSSS